MTVSYITPIYKAGALVGVLGMDIPFDTMVSQISALKVYDTGFYALYDASGTILYHPELPMGSTPGVMGERQERRASDGLLDALQRHEAYSDGAGE